MVVTQHMLTITSLVEAKEKYEPYRLMLKNIKKAFLRGREKRGKSLTNLRFELEFDVPNTDLKNELIRVSIREM
jgi:hypothetical protein